MQTFRKTGKDGDTMTMQQEVMTLTNEVPADRMHLVIEFLRNIVSEQPVNTSASKRIGIAKSQKLYADDYDFDEDNETIAKMFGVV